MEHHPAGSRSGARGPAAWFTGEVTLIPIVDAPEPARLRAAMVTFAPGARTHWHTHPLGQAIHVIAGHGLAQSDGGPVVTLSPGDTVWFAPGERHWHGAAPDCAMTHLAIQEAEERVATHWHDPVSYEDYARR